MRTPIRIGSCLVGLLAGITAVRADTIFVESLTAGQFVTEFGAGTGTFNGIVLPAYPNNFVPETSFVVNGVTYDDQGNGSLMVAGSNLPNSTPPPATFSIGTDPDQLLIDNFALNNANADINMTFSAPVQAVGLIAGDAFGPSVAEFLATFGDSPLDMDFEDGGGTYTMDAGVPTYFLIGDIGGNGISQLNFSDNTGNPTLDTVSSATPEPNSAWLLAIPVLVLGVRKWKTAAASLRSGAAPLALLALVATVAIPSFAQPTNCNLAVPNNPLTAVGLATPYILSGPAGCSQANTTMAFAQAAIYDPAAHTISVYTPLVADAPSPTPPRSPRYVISPVVPKLPANAVVAIWFGYNFDNLTLTGTAVTNTTCFTGFGQFAACNTTAFWNAVNADPTLQRYIYNAYKGQTGSDGLACPTSRSFSIVDQDPNDNLPVSFLLTNEATPRVAQNTAANQAKFTTLFGPMGDGWSIQINPSDEAVVDIFIDGALGCNPPMVADLTDPGTTHASLAVNELFAGLQSGQFPNINNTSIYTGGLKGPSYVAVGDTFNLTPTFTQPNDTATGCNLNLTTGECNYPYTGGDLTAFNNFVAAMGYPSAPSGTIPTTPGSLNCTTPPSAFLRTNQYRAAVNQPAADCTATTGATGGASDASVVTFCRQMFTRTGVGDNSPADLLFNKDLAAFNQATNGPGGGNLFIFLGDRFAASYDLLGCASVFGAANPVNLNNVNATTPNNPVTPYYPTVFP